MLQLNRRISKSTPLPQPFDRTAPAVRHLRLHDTRPADGGGAPFLEPALAGPLVYSVGLVYALSLGIAFSNISMTFSLVIPAEMAA